MTITYQRESIAEVEGEARAFVKEYLAEFPSSFEQEISWETLRAMDALGVLKAVSVRDEGLLVGCCFYTLSLHHHAKNTLVAQELSLYLLPEYRKGRIGIRLLDFIEEAAKEDGAKIMLMTSRGGNLTPLLKLRRYDQLEVVFAKGLG